MGIMRNGSKNLVLSLFLIMLLLFSLQSVLADRNTTAEVLDILGVDSDGNGLYDYMVMDLSVYVNESGYYDVRGYIGQAVEGESISIYSDSVRDIDYSYYFNGETNISLNFTAEDITRDADSDDLFAEYILIEKIGGNRTDVVLNQSLGLTRTDFESYPLPEINFVDYVDYGIDTDDNGYYDYLGINTTVNVSKDGLYTIFSMIKNSNGDDVRFWNRVLDFNEGINVANFNYSGLEISYLEENSNWTLSSLSVGYDDGTGSLGIYGETNVYNTAFYNYTQFEESPRGEIVGVVNEYANDSDGDGLYDSLDLVVQVNVTMVENYTLYAELNSDNSLDEQYDGELQEGLNNITLSFSGLQLYYEEINSTLNVSDVSFRCDYGLDYEEHLYETNAYNYTDFEKPSYILNITNDYANDSDGDGLYDSLILEVEINATNDNNHSFFPFSAISYGDDDSMNGMSGGSPYYILKKVFIHLI